MITAPEQFRGAFLRRGDTGYAAARRHYNERFDRLPAVVARCAGLADVRVALELARAHELDVCVRSGGRGVHGRSVLDGGMVIDVAPMNDVHVDMQTRTALVGPGIANGELLRETAQFGLVPVTGITTHVGFSGSVLTGGQGYLFGRYGNASDNILAADVVLADGTVASASPAGDPDLLWALRGAGDNFGVVSSLRVGLVPAPEAVLVGDFVYDFAGAPATLNAIGELNARLSDDVSLSVTIGFRPDMNTDRGGTTTRQLVVQASHVGPPHVARRELSAFERLDGLIAAEWHTVGYLEHLVASSYPLDGARHYWGLVEVLEWDDRASTLLLEEARGFAEDPDSPLSGIIVWPYRGTGEWRAGAASPGAITGRIRGMVCGLTPSWHDPAEDARHIGAARGFVSRVLASGVPARVYPAIVEDFTPDDVRRFWGEAHARLADLKRRYDPENVFRANANIEPRPTAA